MRKLIVLPVIVILIVGIAVNTILLTQHTSKLGELRSEIVTLGGGVSTLTGDVSSLQGSVSNLQGSVSSLQGSFSNLQGSVSSLQGNVSTLQGNVSTLQGSFSILQGSFSNLQGNVFSLQGNVSSLQGNVSTLQGSFSNLQVKLTDSETKLATLQADLAKANADIVKVQREVQTQQTISSAEAIALVEPTVVRIETDEGSGSGIIISRTGHILTNEHVVSGVASATITLARGSVYVGIVIARDPQRDLAIVRITSNRTDFPEAVLGSSENITAGEEVVAAGYSTGFEGQASFSTGIVSALRVEDGLNYIQTDAAINPGNSGGPLFNLKGQIIAVNVAKYVDLAVEGIGLAIPIDEAKTFIQNTIE